MREAHAPARSSLQKAMSHRDQALARGNELNVISGVHAFSSRRWHQGSSMGSAWEHHRLVLEDEFVAVVVVVVGVGGDLGEDRREMRRELLFKLNHGVLVVLFRQFHLLFVVSHNGSKSSVFLGEGAAIKTGIPSRIYIGAKVSTTLGRGKAWVQ